MEDDADPPLPETSMDRALSDSAVDFDLMDELLSGDCWLETLNYSDLFNQNTTSTSTCPFSCSPIFSLLENNQETEETTVETSELETTMSLSRLIRPRGPVVPLKDRLNHALRLIKESQRGSDVLVQMWVPVQKDGRHFLTTSYQPFWHDSSSQSLVNYRSASTSFQFSAEENSDEIVGLPGRVFLGKVPEWTPDVRYFSSNEYPRVGHALRYNVSGTIALPVFERGSRSCLGVVELVMTTQKINYSSDLENICNALQVCLIEPLCSWYYLALLKM